MDRQKHAIDLIQKYLDQNVTGDELAELERLIASDPDVAERFAHAGRIDAFLAEHFCQEGRVLDVSALFKADATPGEDDVKPRPAHRLHWPWVAAAAIVLLSVATLIWRFSRSGDATEAPAGVPAGYAVLSGRVWVGGAEAPSVRPGQKLSVREGDDAVIQLPDGSQAALSASSEAVLHGRVGETRQVVELIAGGGRFQVTEGKGPFRVETPLGTVTALGTEFTVDLRPGEGNQEGEKLVEGVTVMRSPAMGVLAVAVLVGSVQVDIAGRSYVLFGGESCAFAAESQREGEGGRSKRRGRAFYAKFRGADASQHTVFATHESEGAGKSEVTWDIDRDAEIIIDGKKGKLSDIAEGCSVKVWFANDKRTRVSALEAEGPWIGGRWGRGLRKVDAKKSTITLRAENPKHDKTYPVAKTARILINGKPGKLADLNPRTNVHFRISADMKTVIFIKQGVDSRRRDEERKREGERRVVRREGEGKGREPRREGGDRERGEGEARERRREGEGKGREPRREGGDRERGDRERREVRREGEGEGRERRREGGDRERGDRERREVRREGEGEGRERRREGGDRERGDRERREVRREGEGEGRERRREGGDRERGEGEGRAVRREGEGKGREPRREGGDRERGEGEGRAVRREGEGKGREPRREGGDRERGDREGEGQARRGKRSGRSVSAKLRAVDATQNTLFLTQRRGEEGGRGDVTLVVDVQRDAEIIVDGKKGKLTDLAEGCTVRAWFSDTAKKRVQALEAEGPWLGGRNGQGIRAVDVKKRKITLIMGERSSQDKTYDIAPDAKIVIDGKAAKLADLATGKKAWLRVSANMKRIAYIRQGGERDRRGEEKKVDRRRDKERAGD